MNVSENVTENSEHDNECNGYPTKETIISIYEIKQIKIE